MKVAATILWTSLAKVDRYDDSTYLQLHSFAIKIANRAIMWYHY